MKQQPIEVFLPDCRDVTISRFGFGNLKLGPGVFTYSRLSGHAETCPGASAWCEVNCYARRIEGPVKEIYLLNSPPVFPRRESLPVPAIPVPARLLRLHVSGDFDSVNYVDEWFNRLREAPECLAWAYTRSWRRADLLPALERLRSLPNVQLFASMDPSMDDLPPTQCTECDGRGTVIDAPSHVLGGRAYEDTCPACHGAYKPWRRAWVWTNDARETRLSPLPGLVGTPAIKSYTHVCLLDGTPSYVCPEETGQKPNCVECGYCFEGQRNDVTFLEH